MEARDSTVGEGEYVEVAFVGIATIYEDGCLSTSCLGLTRKMRIYGLPKWIGTSVQGSRNID